MNTQLRWTLLAVALVGSSALSAGLQALPTTYRAVIADWPRGKTGRVQLEGTSASGSVDAQGRFTLLLPTLATSDRLRQELAPVALLFTENDPGVPDDQRCTGQGTATPATAIGSEFELVAWVEGGAPIPLSLYTEAGRTTGLTSGRLLFYDTATTLDGVVTCPDSAVRYRGTFPAGWSLAAHPRPTIDSRTGVETGEITDAVHEGARWHLAPAGAVIGLDIAPLPTERAGQWITGVTPGAPAAHAGVQVNDVLVEVNGQSTVGWSVNQVRAQFLARPGTVVTLGIRRGFNATIHRVPMTLAWMPYR